MPAQFAQLEGRRYVNQDFVNAVRKAYPVTTDKMPLGFACYVGWTGKDLVQFVQTDPGLDITFKGDVYEAVPDPANPEAFDVTLLPNIKHEVLKQTKKQAAVADARRLIRKWGALLKRKAAPQQPAPVKADRGAWLRWD